MGCAELGGFSEIPQSELGQIDFQQISGILTVVIVLCLSPTELVHPTSLDLWTP